MTNMLMNMLKLPQIKMYEESWKQLTVIPVPIDKWSCVDTTLGVK